MRRAVIIRLRQVAVALSHVVAYTVLWLALWVVVPAAVLQWTPVVLTSGSMQPGLDVGDVMIASPHSGEGLGAGTVILYEDPASEGLTTHRIVAVNDDGTYQTKGDGNADADSTRLEPSRVRGVGRLAVPWIGLPKVWARNGNLLGLGLLVLVVAASLGYRVAGLLSRRRTASSVSSPASEPEPTLGALRPVAAHALATPPVDGAEWDDVRTLLRDNGRSRLRAGRPARLGGPSRVITPSREPGSDRSGPVEMAPNQRTTAPRRHSQGRLLEPATMVLTVALAIVVILTTAPVDLAAARFAGSTGPGGGSVTADTLDPPTGLGAATSTPGQVDLSWTPTGDTYAAGYGIYRSEVSGSGYTPVTTVAGQSTSGYTDAFIPTKRSYYYVVQSSYGAWSSGNSNEAIADIGYDGIIEATGGLVSYWRLGLSTTSSVAPDDWGPNDGTPGGGFTPQASGGIVGDPDTAATFNGFTSYVGVGNDPGLQLGSGTIEVWVKTNFAGFWYADLVAKPSAYRLSVRSNVLGVYDDSTGSWTPSGVSINDGAWHHIAMTFQSGVAGGTRVYLDGALVLTSTITVVNQASQVFIGAGGPTFLSRNFAGTLDEVAIYDVVLSQPTVAAHHLAGITP